MHTVQRHFASRPVQIFRQISRRAVLALLATGAASAATRFWDSRAPSQWTPDEIAQLVSNSPWAKQVTAQYRVALEGHAPRPDSAPVQGGRGEGRAGECGLVPCGNIMPGTVTVIWESAQPIREALHPVIPPEFNGHYAISIRGLEIQPPEDQLLAGTRLEKKAGSPIQAALIRRRNNTWVIGFRRELLPLTAADRDVLFTVRLGVNLASTLLRASFSPKEMTWKGELAL